MPHGVLAALNREGSVMLHHGLHRPFLFAQSSVFQGAIILTMLLLFCGCGDTTGSLIDSSQLDTVSITITARNYTQPSQHKVTFSHTTHDASQTQQLYQSLVQGTNATGKSMNCPNASDSYSHYELQFYHKKQLFVDATEDSTGCSDVWRVIDTVHSVTNAYILRYQSSPSSFWPLFHTITDAPIPPSLLR